MRGIADLCGLTTLLSLRCTCAAFKEHVNAILNAERVAIVKHFHFEHDIIWQHLDTAGAIVGGLAALSFVLREPRLLPDVLDVYVSPLQGDHLEQWLEEDEHLDIHSTATVIWTSENRTCGSMYVSRTTTFPCPSSGRSIKIHTSTSHSPLEPIAGSPTTALANWVSAQVFACAYPALTLSRRALGCRAVDHYAGLDTVYDTLRAHRFQIERDPSAWPEWRTLVSPASSPRLRPCLRAFYLCPSQGRYFGDAGSLVNVFDHLRCDHALLRAAHHAPYGIAVAWRMWCDRIPCNGRCAFHDPLLPEDVRTVCAVVPNVCMRSAYVGPP